MKNKKKLSPIFVCYYYYYYYAKDYEIKDEDIIQIEKNINVVEETVNVLKDLFIIEPSIIKVAVYKHFDKVKEHDTEWKPNYNFFKSLEKHLKEIVNTSNFSIQEIRSRLINNE